MKKTIDAPGQTGKRQCAAQRKDRARWPLLARTAALSAALAATQLAAAQASQAQDNAQTVDQAAAGSNQGKDLADLNLDQLMDVRVQVTSVSKKAEDSFQAPAAIFVLTSEDIRRGGFTSLPEALRMVPGLYVARTDANYWTIAARGFVVPNNDKLLVLLDGREMYDPYFGGTSWDTLDVPLEDIDRIEVILGPGGTLWGDNAVDGVINIISKSSKQTQGPSVLVSSGSNEEHTASVRYGGSLGGNLTYRVFGKSSYWDAAVNPVTGASLGDEWSMTQGGFRADWQASPSDNLMFQGQVYQGRVHNTEPLAAAYDQPVVPTLTSAVIGGEDFLVRWDHTLANQDSVSLLGYCAWTRTDDPFASFNRNTCDAEFQHNVAFGTRQSLIWGLRFFTTGDFLPESFTVSFSNPSTRKNTVSGFGQYEIKLVPDRFRVIAGTKLEHNDFTGFEIQPQVRAVWTPTKSQAIWAAVSRAVKLPNRVQTDINLKTALLGNTPPTYLVFVGDPNLQSEKLTAYEMGYRWQVNPSVSFDGSIYYNDYNRIIPNNVPLTTTINPNPFFVQVAIGENNNGAAQTHGGEFYVKIRPVPRWVLTVGETELRGNQQGHVVAGMPPHWANVQSHWDLPYKFEFDSALYYTDFAHGYTPTGPGAPMPTHNGLDLGLAAHPRRGLTVSAWGDDVTANRTLESTIGGPGESYEVGAVRRSIVFQLLWQPDSEQK